MPFPKIALPKGAPDVRYGSLTPEQQEILLRHSPGVTPRPAVVVAAPPAAPPRPSPQQLRALRSEITELEAKIQDIKKPYLWTEPHVSDDYRDPRGRPDAHGAHQAEIRVAKEKAELRSLEAQLQSKRSEWMSLIK
jgi:hypothetical protein